MSPPDFVTVRIDGRVPIAKLCRALATHGLVLSNGADGHLWLHEGPTAPSVDAAHVGLKGEAPSVVVRFPRVFRTEWWRR